MIEVYTRRKRKSCLEPKSRGLGATIQIEKAVNNLDVGNEGIMATHVSSPHFLHKATSTKRKKGPGVFSQEQEGPSSESVEVVCGSKRLIGKGKKKRKRTTYRSPVKCYLFRDITETGISDRKKKKCGGKGGSRRGRQNQSGSWGG